MQEKLEKLIIDRNWSVMRIIILQTTIPVSIIPSYLPKFIEIIYVNIN